MIPEKVVLIQGLLTLGTTDILRRMTLCCAGLTCELWDIWEHPWHLHTRYQYHPRTWQPKMLPDVTECPLGCKLVPLTPHAIENYTSNSSLGIWLVYFIMQIHVFNFLDKGYSWCFRQWQRAGVYAVNFNLVSVFSTQGELRLWQWFLTRSLTIVSPILCVTVSHLLQFPLCQFCPPYQYYATLPDTLHDPEMMESKIRWYTAPLCS